MKNDWLPEDWDWVDLILRIILALCVGVLVFILVGYFQLATTPADPPPPHTTYLTPSTIQEWP